MAKFNLAATARNVWAATKKHSPEILTGIGIAGMITTTIMAVKATPKAIVLIEKKKEETDTDKLTPADMVKTAAKCYVPAAIIGAVSTACLIGASSTNLRRNTALATAYTLSESTLKEYQDKVIETFGEKKEQSVRDSISKDKITKNPPREVIVTGRGETMCLDSLSGRYFKGDIDKIRKAVNELNRRMRTEMFISLNEYYDEINLDHIAIGDDLGWHIDDGYIDLDFSAQLDENETPCIVVNYRVAPMYNYRFDSSYKSRF